MTASVITRQPVFQHDCEDCIYLGPADTHHVNDLYVHPGEGETVIARYGKDGDYVSGLALADRVPELALAVVRANKLNLLSA